MNKIATKIEGVNVPRRARGLTILRRLPERINNVFTGIRVYFREVC